jgi:transcriptional regulator with PAS, ATPase and Fis domain
MNIHANVLNTGAADMFFDSLRKDVLKITGDALKENSIQSIASCYATQDPATKRMLTAAITYAEESLQKYNVLIEGPSGTGKELVARILSHKRKPLKAMNMAGLTDTLFQSELFGYMPGAFTGAKSRGDVGFLRAVGKGTAFLDEIGELPLAHQAKLLRVLQDKTVLPVGAVDPVPIQCRFVFATNRDLLKMVKEGSFREDLYFRINELGLKTRSLYDRGVQEIRCVASAIIAEENWTPLGEREHFGDETFSFGNVRALRNLLLKRELGEIELPEYDKEGEL